MYRITEILGPLLGLFSLWKLKDEIYNLFCRNKYKYPKITLEINEVYCMNIILNKQSLKDA